MSAVGLIGLSLVTIKLLRDSLLRQKDSQVQNLSEQRLTGGGRHGKHDGPGDPGTDPTDNPNAPTAFFQSFYDAAGGSHMLSRSGADKNGGLSVDFDPSKAIAGKPFTAPGLQSSRYRVVVEPAVSSVGPGYLVSAIDIADVDLTVGHLVRNEIGAIAIGLGLLGLLTWFIVRSGLKPLNHMADTAGAIAAGDLSARVESTNAKTEVGRLGGALNTMLGRIEAAFAERTRSEDKLRRFVADASHELRTPLTSIRGYSELLRTGAIPAGDDSTSALSRIESEATRMGVLVDDLLLLARLDQGRPLERHAVDLAQLANDAVSDARITDPDRQWSIIVAPDALVIGDESRLRQIVGNLLTNARTHTPAGTPVDVSVAAVESDIELVVADHGTGVPPGEETRIFERFARLDDSRQRASGGTGLGLAIVNAIAWSHGGRVGVRTTPGGGASFWLRLPNATTANDTPWPAPTA